MSKWKSLSYTSYFMITASALGVVVSVVEKDKSATIWAFALLLAWLIIQGLLADIEALEKQLDSYKGVPCSSSTPQRK